MAKKTIKQTIDDIVISTEEHMYEIPSNWCWTRIGALVEICLGLTHTPTYVDSGIPFISVKDMSSGYLDMSDTKYITKEEYDSLPYGAKPKKGDILFARVGTIGVPQVLDIDEEIGTFVSLGFFRLHHENVLREYICHWMNSVIFDEQVAKNVKGSTLKNLNTGWLKDFQIPLPPLAEQKRIVEQIENLFTKLDEAKENSCEVLDKTRLRKSAILQAAFVGRLTSKWRSDNGIEADSWKTKKIGDIVKPVKDKYDPIKDEILDIPYVGLEHIEKSGGIIGSGSPEEVKSTKTLFNKGDVLYGKLRPYLDKHDVVDFDGMCSTDILVYRAENEATARYINYLFGTIDFMDYAVENSSGINLPRTSEKIVSAYEVKVPTVEEQDVICDILDSMMQRENAIIDAAEDFIEKVDLMKKSILAKAFRGELSTNISEEESSIELLKKILENN